MEIKCIQSINQSINRYDLFLELLLAVFVPPGFPQGDWEFGILSVSMIIASRCSASIEAFVSSIVIRKGFGVCRFFQSKLTYFEFV
mmetsp:Transcript_15388/g.42675  ORF Transcript_15388/g.42675 Transcript_15388/m.42675 type:complete len:86 (+) Transcript_15388:295-552(+)